MKTSCWTSLASIIPALHPPLLPTSVEGIMAHYLLESPVQDPLSYFPSHLQESYPVIVASSLWDQVHHRQKHLAWDLHGVLYVLN